MRFQRILFGLCLVAALSVCGAQAEQFVTMQFEAPYLAGGEKSPTESYTIWVGDAQIREDRAERSVIVDRKAAKMFVVEHAVKTYREFDIPLKFEKLIPADMVEQWKSVLAARKTEVTIEPSTETATIAGFAVKRYDAVIASSMGGTMNLTLWNTADPGFDASAYKDLMLEMAAFQPGADEWIRKLFTIEGYPVRMVREFKTPEGTVVSTEQLISVVAKKAPEGIWRPSADYAEVEFNLLTEPIR